MCCCGGVCEARSGDVDTGIRMIVNNIPEAAMAAEVMCKAVRWLPLGWKWWRWPWLYVLFMCCESDTVVALLQLELQVSDDSGHDFL